MEPDTLDSKTSAEVIPVVFVFSSLLTSIDTVLAVNVTVKSGIDSNPDNLKLGSPIISGSLVVQPIKAGIDGNTYLLNCTVQSGMEVYSIACYLPIVDYR
jgi:hypothetical protein